ncbi:PadR family transcriptional regulator [uncultured Vagococcus sp.]|uniref:PadR family transcriptional regulator n=1 Tax=uncultured Vagococcus sp. TaxID=189676 RepID=UPI0028D4CB08|nr:PadR family transcriptional regulator [uncultured Vagococcus sp.]
MNRQGRQTDAYLLLFLAESDSYGGQLVKRCEEEIPFNSIDSAIVYRTLKKLEGEGSINSYYEALVDGKPVKMYQITIAGKELLEQLKIRIENKIENFHFFLSKFEEIEE